MPEIEETLSSTVWAQGSITKQNFELPDLYFLQLANNSLIGSLPENFWRFETA